MSEWIRTKAYVPEPEGLDCGECFEIIYTCSDCGSYFMPLDIINCNGEKHLCESCYDARMEE